MKTEAELNNDILEITMLIRDKHPELSKYLNEMPITIPEVNKPEITLKILSDYKNSLIQLLDKYVENHDYNF